MRNSGIEEDNPGGQNEPKEKFRVIEYDGQPARLYPDGSMRDEQGGYLTVPPGANGLFTAETGREAARARWERKREEFAKGLVEGANLPENQGDAEAWAAIGKHATEVFLSTENARGLAELGRFLAEHSGFTPSRNTVNAQQNNFYLEGGGTDTSAILDAMRRDPVFAPFYRLLTKAAYERWRKEKKGER